MSNIEPYDINSSVKYSFYYLGISFIILSFLYAIQIVFKCNLYWEIILAISNVVATIISTITDSLYILQENILDKLF